MSDQAAGSPQTLLIRVGDQRLAVPIAAVDGVILTPTITPVPGGPPRLVGLLNHQGTIYAALRLPGAPGIGRHAVLASAGSLGRVALLCDWVDDLADVPPADGVELLDVEVLARDAARGFTNRLSESGHATSGVVVELRGPEGRR